MRANIIIGIIVGIALLVGGYLFFFNTSPVDTSALTNTNSGNVSAAQEQFIQLSTQASSINFDTTILSDYRFTSLQNTDTPLQPVSTGRADPFSPLPGSGT
jgi:hypothetical protein